MMISSSLSKAAAFGLSSGAIATANAVLMAAGIYGTAIGFMATLLSLGCLAFAFLYMARVRAALRRAAATCMAASRGDLEVRILEEPETGLIGDLQRGINNMLDISDAFVREASGSMKAVSESRFNRKVLLRGLPGAYQNAARVLNAATTVTETRTTDFANFVTDNVAQVMDTVAAAAGKIRVSAEAMSGACSDGVSMSSRVSTAAADATHNVQSVASATEELATSVGEIGRQVEGAVRVSREATDKAAQTMRKMTGLREAAGRIGNAVNLITSIASQTNLLALNATIEASRAGEAGKGFAVVAQEVKTLATQTAKATDEISSVVQAIQTATQEAVEAIQEINVVIGNIDGISSSISASVVMQEAVTQEIARNVTEAAAGTETVAVSIDGIANAAMQTGTAARQVLLDADELTVQSAQLKAEMQVQAETFLRRAA